jgi:RNA recognition motif-containing protein
MNNTIYLSNLSYERDRNGIRSLLSSFGRIKNIKIIVEPTTNQSRGMAFVEMNSIDEAKAAIKFLDQKNIDGRTVKARFATALRPTSMSKTQETAKRSKDLEFKEVQLMKKKRNLEKRSSRPF